MNHPFSEYAQYYDLLYKDKPYHAEARFVADILARHMNKPPENLTLLDLACGTGRHTQEFATLGFQAEGSDISREMIALARARAEASGLSIRFYNESFQSCDRIGRQYDAVIVMFAAINYLTDYRELEKSLFNIRRLLKPAGVLIFDFWNGNSVVKSYSPVRVKSAEDGDRRVLRTSNTTLDTVAQTAFVRFDFVLTKAGAVLREFSEIHRIRYFFPQEMSDFLLANGFEVVYRCPFLVPDAPLAGDEWNLTYMAKPCE